MLAEFFSDSEHNGFMNIFDVFFLIVTSVFKSLNDTDELLWCGLLDRFISLFSGDLFIVVMPSWLTELTEAKYIHNFHYSLTDPLNREATRNKNNLLFYTEACGSIMFSSSVESMFLCHWFVDLYPQSMNFTRQDIE